MLLEWSYHGMCWRLFEFLGYSIPTCGPVTRL